MATLELTLDYSQLQLLEYHLKKCHGKIIEQQFTDQVDVVISLPLREKEQIKNLFPRY